MKYQILDCTLRDGGYYTDWNFPFNLVKNYLKVISKTPIKYVELGYLSSQNDTYGPYFHLNTKILKDAKKILNKDQKISVMINAKEIKDSRTLINLISESHKFIDTIRFAVDIEKLNIVRDIVKVKKKYKKISFNLNLMYLSKWIDDHHYAKDRINFLKDKCDAISLVDSYGALKPHQIFNFFEKIKNLNIKLGCHFHNNCGLALANSLAAIEAGCKLVDTTIKGMGRGAGNAETELLLALNHSKEIKISGFEFNNSLEEFEKMKSKLKWGSSYAYAYAASNGYSQSEMMDLIQKRRLNVGLALKTISSKIKNKDTIKFENYQIRKKILKIPPVLIGGAESFISYGQNFLENLNPKQTIILSGSNALSNFLDLKIKLKNPIFLIISGSELEKIQSFKKEKKNKLKNISAFIVEKEFFFENDLLRKYKNKIIFSSSIGLNPLTLTGLFLIKIKISSLSLAFFDGQPETEKGRIVMEETEKSLKFLRNKGLKIHSYTKTFLNVNQVNPWI